MSASDLWPMDILAPKDLDWRPDTAVNSGGRTLSNLEQLDRVDGGPLWRASMVGIPLHCREKILPFQMLQGLLVGQLETIVLPRMPADRSPALRAQVGVPHSDGTSHSDGTLYVGQTMAAATTVAADLNAYMLTFDLVGALPLLGGEEFTFSHPIAGPRMYRILRILAHEGDSYTVTLMQNLRDDVPAGTLMDFDDPRCLMRVEDRDRFAAALSFNRWGTFDAEFLEAYW